MSFTIYGTRAENDGAIVCGSARTVVELQREFKRLKSAGVTDPYAIGFDPESTRTGQGDRRR